LLPSSASAACCSIAASAPPDAEERPTTSQDSFSASGRSGCAYRRTRGSKRRAGDLHAHALGEVGADGQDVERRVVDGAGEAQHALLDIQRWP
jgi:hypothetical protein